MSTYNKLLKEYTLLSKKLNKEESSIRRLLIELTNGEIYKIIDEEYTDEFYQDFKIKIDKYLYDNIPIQHILGYEYFFGNKFIVNKNVLIPRRETEELVENTLYLYDKYFNKKEIILYDIATGSGCIGITLNLEEPNIKVIATDISKEALIVAKQNNDLLNANVTFLEGDLLKPVIGKEKADILISNPPYIPKNEEVDSLVKDNEPHIALFDKEDGLYFYNEILKDSKKVLKENNIIGFEHAYNRKEDMYNLARKYYKDSVILQIEDMQGLDRMTFIINWRENK